MFVSSGGLVTPLVTQVCGKSVLFCIFAAWGALPEIAILARDHCSRHDLNAILSSLSSCNPLIPEEKTRTAFGSVTRYVSFQIINLGLDPAWFLRILCAFVIWFFFVSLCSWRAWKGQCYLISKSKGCLRHWRPWASSSGRCRRQRGLHRSAAGLAGITKVPESNTLPQSNWGAIGLFFCLNGEHCDNLSLSKLWLSFSTHKIILACLCFSACKRHRKTTITLRAVLCNTLQYVMLCSGTSIAAQGGGGSFKNRKPIGEVGCCESRMAERIHWWTDRWLELCFLNGCNGCSGHLITTAGCSVV